MSRILGKILTAVVEAPNFGLSSHRSWRRNFPVTAEPLVEEVPVRRPMPLVIALLLVAAAAGCGGGDESGAGNPIRIGQIVSLTGNYSPLGSENQKSVALAVDQLNAAGGVGGRRIELTVRDDKSLPDQSVL